MGMKGFLKWFIAPLLGGAAIGSTLAILTDGMTFSVKGIDQKTFLVGIWFALIAILASTRK